MVVVGAVVVVVMGAVVVVVMGAVVVMVSGAGSLVTTVVSGMFTPPPPGSPVHAVARTTTTMTIPRVLTTRWYGSVET